MGDFSVLSKKEPLPPPSDMTIYFSDEGTQVFVNFNALTDQAGMSGSWVCADLLDFPQAAYSSCSWVSFSRIAITPKPTLDGEMINIGDPISFLPGALKLKAFCNAERLSDCLKWNHAKFGTISSATIKAPVTAVTPKVSIVAPETIGTCDDLNVDVSSSSGSGGRAWISTSISVESSSSNATQNAMLDAFLLNDSSVL